MTFWAINILCILAVVGCLHSTWKKRISSCIEVKILTDSFVSLHALLFRHRIEIIVDAHFMLNNKLRNKFLLGHVGIIRVLQKLVHSSGVSILDTHLTDTVFICWNAQNIYSPKVVFTCRFLSLVTTLYKKQMDWIGLSSVLRPRQHSIGYIWDGI